MPSWNSPLYPWHWTLTNEQKALAVATSLLLILAVLKERGISSGLAKVVWTKLERLLSRKRPPGVLLGPVYLSDDDRVRHCHIVGTPGSGKTEITKTLVFEDIRRGRGCFIIDAKGDRELFEEVRGFSRSVGRLSDLHLLSATYSDESSVWNPCGLGNTSELQSKFLNANVYSDPFYAKACEFGLLQAFQTLVTEKPDGFNLSDLVTELDRLASRQKGDVFQGLYYDFGSLTQGEWSEVLGCDPSSSKRPEISFLDIVQRNQILFVDLPTEGKSIQSSRIGRLLTQEMILLSGMRKAFPSLNQSGVFSVFIDEFDAFATESFVSFLNKGRSSRFMIHIIHQTISDLKRISPEFAGQILGLCNIHLICRQDDPDDAEFWSRFIGTKTVVKRTFQSQDGSSTGLSSNREAQEFLVGPDRIKNLGIGECIISVKTQKVNKSAKLSLPPRHSDGKLTEPTSEKIGTKVRGLCSGNQGTLESKPTPNLSAQKWDLLMKENAP